MNMLVKNSRRPDFWGLDFPASIPSVEEFMRKIFGHDAVSAADSGLDVKINEQNVTVKLACPGCKKDEFEIEVVGDFVTVKVSRTEPEPAKNDRRLMRERAWGQLEESVKLGVPVQGGATRAEYADGVLTLTIPRADEKAIAKHVVQIH